MWKTKQMISSLMEEFDFDRVYSIMELIWWVWAMPDGAKMPNVEEMKEFVGKHLKETCDRAKLEWDDCSTSCWWFDFYVSMLDWKVSEIELKFIPVQWFTFREDFI